MTKKKIFKIIIVIFACLNIYMVLYSCYHIYKYFYDIYTRHEDIVYLKSLISEDIDMKNDTDKKEINREGNQEKFKKLYDINNDFVGWLQIPGTVIDYPVMQTPEDEEFYLRKDFYKRYSNAGTLFCNAKADLKMPSDNIIIYGHHMQSHTMFESLCEYDSEEYYKNHRYIIFNTIYGDGVYEVIAAYKTDVQPGTYEYYNFVNGTEGQFNEYISYAKSNMSYDIESSAKYGDKLLTLSTCAYHTYNGRFVVIAKKISENSYKYQQKLNK